MLKMLAAAAAVLICGAGTAVAQDKDARQTFKLGVVNLRICFDKDKYERVKEVDAELQKLADDFTKKVQDIDRKMEQLREQIAALPPESKLRAEKILQLRRLEVDLKFEKEYGKAQYLDFYSDKKMEIYNEIRRVVGLIAQEQKYDLILRIESPSLAEADPEPVTQRINSRVVLYSHDNVDITALVVERLNAEFKKIKAAGGGDKKEEKKEPEKGK